MKLHCTLTMLVEQKRNTVPHYDFSLRELFSPLTIYKVRNQRIFAKTHYLCYTKSNSNNI